MNASLLAGRYELGRPIGRGGMAEVWEARDSVLGRTVALKTVNLAAAHDPTLGERLRREAVATAALTHPGVVTVYDAGVDGDTAYLVMELLEGRDLAAVLRDGPLSVSRAVQVGEQVAGALAAAHAAGIVHRDVKPGNVILDGDKVTVVDFGIAAVEQEAGAGLTAEGSTVGTAEYMAPEQATGEAVTPATDMYAFGCLMTAVLTARTPFSGSHPVEVLNQHLSAEPPRLADLRPDVPAELDELVAGLLRKDPGSRPSSADVRAVLAGLSGASPHAAGAATEVLGAGTTRVMPGAAGAAAGAAAGPRGGAGGATPPHGPARRDRRWLGPTAVVGAVLLVLGVVAWALRPPADPGVAPSPGAVSEPATEPTGSAAEQPTAEEPGEEQPATGGLATEGAGEQEPGGPAEPAEPAEPEQQPAEDPMAALISGLSAEESVREDLLKNWRDVAKAQEQDNGDKVADRSQDMVKRLDELTEEGRLSSTDRDAVEQQLVALVGPVALEDRDDRDD